MSEKLMYIPCNMCEYVNMMLLLLAPAEPSIVSGFMRCVKMCTTKSKIKRQVLGILSAQNSKRDLVTYSFFRTNQSLQDLYREHNRKMLCLCNKPSNAYPIPATSNGFESSKDIVHAIQTVLYFESLCAMRNKR